MTDMMNADESAQLVTAFQQLGVKPKADSPDALKQWMLEYLHSTGTLQPKQEEPDTANTVKDFKSTVIHNVPRIASFSGDPAAKSDTTFELWLYEVKCLMNDKTYSPEVLLQAVRKSLKGEAGHIVMRLGVRAKVSDILDKLYGVFGNVELSEDLLAKFYSSHQQAEEDIATWSCRLEDLLDKVVSKGQISCDAVSEMLRQKFWNGLREPLKSRSGHKFDAIKDYDLLRIQMRRIEYDLQRADHEDGHNKPHGEKTKVVANMNVSQYTDTNLHSSPQDKLTGLVQTLCTKVDDLQHEMKHLKSSNNLQTTNISSVQTRSKPQKSYSQTAQSCTNLASNFERARSDNFSSQVYRKPPSYPHSIQSSPRGRSDAARVPNASYPKPPEPQCWRCGQFGHLQHGCRVLLNKPVNYNASTTRGDW
jgi:hypothetical protein